MITLFPVLTCLNGAEQKQEEVIILVLHNGFKQ